MLPRQHRLRRPGDFARVRKEGRAWSHPLFVLAAAPNGGTTTRVGFSVSKRVGKAHVRNRARRLLREATRMYIARMAPGYDVVISSRPALAGQPFSVVAAAMERQLRAARLLRTDSDQI